MNRPLVRRTRPAGVVSAARQTPLPAITSGRIRLALLAEILLVLLFAAGFVFLGARALPGGDVLVRVQDHQVAVLTDYWAGSQRSVTSPGYQVVIPQLQDVHTIDKSPVEFVLQGSKLEGSNHAAQLIVRASDGSSFWFNRISAQYGIDPGKLDSVLRDLGPGAPLESGLVGGYIRSILRDEFGRYSPEEIVLPENLQAAVSRARERLNGRLARHGIEVYEIAVSKPSFDPQYEATIERAKVAEQEIESLEQKASQLVAGQEARLDELRQTKALALKKAQAKWQGQLTALQKEAERLGAGQQDELARLRRYQELTLEKSRAKWNQELQAGLLASAALQAHKDDELKKVRRKMELEFEKNRSEWDRELAKLREEARFAQAGRESRLLEVRSGKELELEKLRGQWLGALEKTRSEIAQQESETDIFCATRRAAGELEREQQLARAAALAQRYGEEAESLLARSKALAEHGLSAVRAALIEKLQTIAFEIVPVPPENSTVNQPTPAIAAAGSNRQ
jgi:hypothetical protein